MTIKANFTDETTKPPTYGDEVYELGKLFLEDETIIGDRATARDSLARAIQQAIEDWFAANSEEA